MRQVNESPEITAIAAWMKTITISADDALEARRDRLVRDMLLGLPRVPSTRWAA